jgi:hypothetical protein
MALSRFAHEPTLWQKQGVNPEGFFAELSRRNICKVAVAYAVANWLLIQGVSD